MKTILIYLLLSISIFAQITAIEVTSVSVGSEVGLNYSGLKSDMDAFEYGYSE